MLLAFGRDVPARLVIPLPGWLEAHTPEAHGTLTSQPSDATAPGRPLEASRGLSRRLSPAGGSRPLLLDDPDLDLGLHVRVQADRHPVDAERSDGVVQVDHALLDLEALLRELLRDVGGRHRPEQLALLADAR